MASVKRNKNYEYKLSSVKYAFFCSLITFFILIAFNWKAAGTIAIILFLNYFLFKSRFNKYPDTPKKLRFSKVVKMGDHSLMESVENNPSKENIDKLKKHLKKS
jgi:hypothetical protein